VFDRLETGGPEQHPNFRHDAWAVPMSRVRVHNEQELPGENGLRDASAVWNEELNQVLVELLQ
jgi:hypothetical protein